MRIKVNYDKIIYFCIFSGFALYTLDVSRFFFDHFFSSLDILSNPLVTRGVIRFLAFFLMIFAAVVSFWSEKINQKPMFASSSPKFIFLFLVCIVLMTVIGIANHNSRALIYVDFERAVLLLSGIFIGARKRNWEFIDKICLYTLLWGIIASIISLTTVESIFRKSVVTSLLDTVEPLLYPSAFFLIFFYSARKSKASKRLIIFSFAFYCVQQILFQKRLPTVRVLSIMLLIPLIRHIFQKRPLLLYATSVLKRILILILPIIVLSLILVMSGVNIFESASELKERYQGEAGIIETTLNDARFRLGALAIKNIAKEGAVFGRGFGASSIDKRLWGFSELGEMDPDLPPSRVILEVGQIWPLTRGGTVFLIIFNGMLLSIIFSRSKYKNSYFSLACWACILVFFVFSFGEFFLGRPFYSYTILLGACIGYLLSVNRFKENDIGGRLLIKGQPGK